MSTTLFLLAVGVVFIIVGFSWLGYWWLLWAAVSALLAPKAWCLR